MKSEAISKTGEVRLDSNYYQKAFINNERKINSLKTNKLIDLTYFIKKGIFDLPPTNYLENGIPLIRTSEIKNPTIDFSTTVFINEKINSQNNNTILFTNDLVFTKIGAYIGDVAILPNDYSIYNFSQNVTGISLIDKDNGAYLLSFFLSNIGKTQILRSVMLSGQGKLELADIRNYEIPIVSDVFIKAIQKIYYEKGNYLKQSKSHYLQAEILLLHEIGLTNTVSNLPLTTSINIKNFTSSFGVTGRLDAEYYQPKYETIIEKIKSQRYDSLQNIVTITKSIEPGSDYYSDDEIGLPFMRVADFNKFGLSEPNKKLTAEFIKENQDKINKLKPKKGSILFSKDGSVGTAYHLREDFEGITSSAILNLKVKNEKEIVPEYLTLTLNSKLVQMQAERDSGGSIILHWRIGEIQNVIVPIIDYSKQQQIAKLVEESFTLKKQSEHLLEVAKRAVEIAIEENEEVAMQHIENNTN